MTPPRHAISVDDQLEHAAKRLGWLKVIAAAGVALMVIGGAAAAWDSEHATRDDVERVSAGAAAERAAMKAETLALRDRVTRTEVDLAWIKAQLVEIAKATGARSVPPQP